ncbi:hypothetical protein ACRXCV_00045 (plasmid) [Halobacteriovorax sp. GFR7]|uniref:hypothetical protein n=1 Tax=unclassified Halobacteriovorax TaxID=2639665 RepID=UPI003D995297
MVVKVKLPKTEDMGHEPVVDQEQDAPIVGKDVEWKAEGSVNDGHQEAEPKGEVPKKQAPSECGDSGACGLPEAPPTSDSSNSSGLPESPPLDAYDDVPWDDTDTSPDGQGANDAPSQPTETEAAKAEGDGQGEEPSEVETPAQETGSEVESVCTDELVDDSEAVAKAAVTTDQSMSSHGKLIASEHQTEMVPLPAQVGQIKEMAKVRYSCGFTKNVGEFNSFRAEVSVELPCLPEDAEISKTYNRAVEIVDTRLQELYDQADVQVSEQLPVAQEPPKPEPMEPPKVGGDLPPPPPM